MLKTQCGLLLRLAIILTPRRIIPYTYNEECVDSCSKKILVRPADENHAACRRLCIHARKIRNSILYITRQAFLEDGHISPPESDKILKSESPEIYFAISAASSQRIGQIVGDSWKSYFELRKMWYDGELEKRPSLPGYSKSATTFSVGRNGFRISDGRLHISGGNKIGYSPIQVTCCENQPFNSKASQTVVRDVRIVPLGTSFVIELVYDREEDDEIELDKTRVASLDPGVNNLLAIITNQPGISPVLVSGRSLKALNAQFNRDKAALAKMGKARHIGSKVVKRKNAIDDYFHKTSRWLIDWCIENRIGTLVIGKNIGWKDGINIGRRNNQTFTSLPHAQLIDMITYKAGAKGIDVITREESYTSKASALDLDPVPDFDKACKVKHAFSGRRIKRGLYRTSTGRLINADINGALNILRKEIGDGWVSSIADKGRVDRPVRIKHIDSWLGVGHRAVETTV